MHNVDISPLYPKRSDTNKLTLNKNYIFHEIKEEQTSTPLLGIPKRLNSNVNLLSAHRPHTNNEHSISSVNSSGSNASQNLKNMREKMRGNYLSINKL